MSGAMRGPRQNHTAALKANFALTALKGDRTLSELAEKHGVHANKIAQWKTQLLKGVIEVFMSRRRCRLKIGLVALEPLFRTLFVAASAMRVQSAINKTHPLTAKRQTDLLEILRSNVYYMPAPTPESDLAIVRAIDNLHLEHPCLGARQLHMRNEKGLSQRTEPPPLVTSAPNRTLTQAQARGTPTTLTTRRIDPQCSKPL